MNFENVSKTAKIGVGALCLGLYTACSAWIIRAEGETYRKRLRDDRHLATTDIVPVPAQTPEGPGPEARPADVETKPREPIVKSEPPSLPPTIPSESRLTPATAPPSVATSARPLVEARPATPAPSIDPFWDQPEQKKIWDLDHLTVEGEKRLGADLNQMVLHFHKPLEVGPLPERLEKAAEPYLAHRSRKELSKYTLTVLDCDESNVFSHPGGYIYVCRGLFDWIDEDEDYALEFVVAHEIAHVDSAHALNCLRDPEVKKFGMGTVAQFYALAIPWGYKPEQDVEADQWAAQKMRQEGRSPHERKAFLRKLDDFARRSDFKAGRKKPTEEPILPPLDNHLWTHPVARVRLKELKTLLD